MYRQISCSEAIYRLLSTLNLRGSNLKTTFVTSGFPDNRSVVFLPNVRKDDEVEENEEELEETNNDSSYSIAGRKGKYRKIKTIHERYSMRPKAEVLENMCLAIFATTYETVQAPKKPTFINQISEEKSKPDDDIPKYIILENGTYMKARESNSVLRIHSSKKKKDYEEYYSEILLFYPWRNECEDLKPRDAKAVIDLYQRELKTILENRQSVLPYSTMVTEMKECLENNTDMRPMHISDILDSTLEQLNDDDKEMEEPFDDTPVVVEEDNSHHLNTSGIRYKIPIVDDEDTMLNLARALGTEQRMVFDKFVDYVKKIKCQRKIVTNDFSPPRMIATGIICDAYMKLSNKIPRNR